MRRMFMVRHFVVLTFESGRYRRHIALSQNQIVETEEGTDGVTIIIRDTGCVVWKCKITNHQKLLFLKEV